MLAQTLPVVCIAETGASVARLRHSAHSSSFQQLCFNLPMWSWLSFSPLLRPSLPFLSQFFISISSYSSLLSSSGRTAAESDGAPTSSAAILLFFCHSSFFPSLAFFLCHGKEKGRHDGGHQDRALHPAQVVRVQHHHRAEQDVEKALLRLHRACASALGQKPAARPPSPLGAPSAGRKRGMRRGKGCRSLEGWRDRATNTLKACWPCAGAQSIAFEVAVYATNA